MKSVDNLCKRVKHLEKEIAKFKQRAGEFYSTNTLDDDIDQFKKICDKYLPGDLTDFYIKRIRCASNESNVKHKNTSTISALCDNIINNDN